MNRRGFLGALAAGFAAPAIVRAESLMKIVVPKREIIGIERLFTFDSVNEPGIVGAHPLHFGNMVWRPELTMVVPISRLERDGNQPFSVQPRQPHRDFKPMFSGEEGRFRLLSVV